MHQFFFTLNTGCVQSAPIDIYPGLRTYLLSGQFTNPFIMIVRVQRSRKLKTPYVLTCCGSIFPWLKLSFLLFIIIHCHTQGQKKMKLLTKDKAKPQHMCSQGQKELTWQ